MKKTNREMLDIVSEDRKNPKEIHHNRKTEIGKWYDGILQKILMRRLFTHCGKPMKYIRCYDREGFRIKGEFICDECGYHVLEAD